MLKMEGTGGFLVPHSGYVEVELQIPAFPSYGEKVLKLVIKDGKYSLYTPIQIGTRINDTIMMGITQEDPIIWRKYGEELM